MDQINLSIETKANLLIGGVEQEFEIGGVDLSTVMNVLREPVINASTFKGIYRKILEDRDGHELSIKVLEILRKYFESMKAEVIRQSADKVKAEEKWNKIMDNLKASQILGISGVNGMPKVLFTDFLPVPGQNDYFSIDTKNRIEEDGDNISSRPRTYKCIRPGITFKGRIDFYQFQKYDDQEQIIKKYLEEALSEFNEGIYRLGNSKSRGYGLIRVEVL